MRSLPQIDKYGVDPDLHVDAALAVDEADLIAWGDARADRRVTDEMVASFKQVRNKNATPHLLIRSFGVDLSIAGDVRDGWYD